MMPNWRNFAKSSHLLFVSVKWFIVPIIRELVSGCRIRNNELINYNDQSSLLTVKIIDIVYHGAL